MTVSTLYIKRTLEPVIQRAVKEFPSVLLTGPRQSGKTTLLKHLFGKKYRYISLEPPDIRIAASENPRGFLQMYPPPVIFDEAQYVPNLFPYIKEKIDTKRSLCGQYVITGSQNLLLTKHITESLAGRTAILKLLPLSMRESTKQPQKRLPWERKELRCKKKTSLEYFWKTLLRGNYPELIQNPKRHFSLWHSSYVQTYLERDVRSLRQIGDLTQFQSFLRTLAARSAQLLSLSDISRDLGITVNTIKAWISVLEATYQIIVLRPYFANIGKRLMKTPKIYFTDTGTLCHIVGLKDPEHAALGPMGGAIFETAVISEAFKTLIHRGIDPHLYFWRTSSGTEVDLIMEFEKKLIPIEIKLTATPKPTMTKNLKTFLKDFEGKTLPGYVLHTGDQCFPLADGITALPFTWL